MLNYRNCGLLLSVLLSEVAASRTVAVDIAPDPVSAQQAPVALLVDLSSGQTRFARESDARLVYNGPVRAPLAKGTHVATLEIHGTGLPDRSIPLVVMRAIGLAGPIDRVMGGLLGLFS